MTWENIVGKAFSMTELSLTSAGRILLWLSSSFICCYEGACLTTWSKGSERSYGVSQDTNLLQLPSCAEHKMIFTYVAFSRQTLHAAPNQSKEMRAYLHYFCEAFSIMTLLLFHPLNKELTLGKQDILIAVCMCKYSFWMLPFEILEIPKSRLAMFLGWLVFLFCFAFYFVLFWGFLFLIYCFNPSAPEYHRTDLFGALSKFLNYM